YAASHRNLGLRTTTDRQKLDALQAEIDAVKRLQESTAAELAALPPAILDRAILDKAFPGQSAIKSKSKHAVGLQMKWWTFESELTRLYVKKSRWVLFAISVRMVAYWPDPSWRAERSYA